MLTWLTMAAALLQADVLPRGTDLLPNPDFRDEAIGWELEGAATIAGTDSDGHTPIRLETGRWFRGDGTASTSIIHLPVRPMSVDVIARGEATEAWVSVSAWAWAWSVEKKGWEDIDRWEENFVVSEAWEQRSLRLRLPERAQSISLSVSNSGSEPLLVRSVHLTLAEGPDEPHLETGQLRDLFAGLHDVVVELRGRPFSHPVLIRWTDDEMLDSAASPPEGADPHDRLHEYVERAWRLIGLLPERDLGLNDYARLLGNRLAAKYDGHQKTVFIRGSTSPAILPAVLVHELTHALDDQVHGLHAFQSDLSDLDRHLRHRSVVEGSATVVMASYADVGVLETLVERKSNLEDQPDIIKRIFAAPYPLGSYFILRGDTGRVGDSAVNSDIDGVFNAPPRSFEQVLHPEKYWSPDHRDEPIEVTLPHPADAVEPGWRVVADGTLGELALAAFVDAPMPPLDETLNSVPADWIDESVIGWGGDRWELWSDEENDVVVLVTVWDSEFDAEQFRAELPALDGRAVASRERNVVLAAGHQAPKVVEFVLAWLTDD